MHPTGTPTRGAATSTATTTAPRWTEHVASHGRQSTDPPGGTGAHPHRQPGHREDPARHRQGRRPAGPAAGGGSLFTEPVLVVNQKAKLIEINQEFAVYDQQGTQIGAVRQVGQSAAKKVLRLRRRRRPVPHPQVPGRRLRRAGRARADPAGEVHEVAADRRGRRRPGDRPDRPAEHDRQDPVRARGRRPADRVAQRRELARLELQHPGPHRPRGRPDHQDLGGPREDACSRPPTTTWSQIHEQLRSRCTAWSSRPRSASTPRSSRTPAASTRPSRRGVNRLARHARGSIRAARRRARGRGRRAAAGSDTTTSDVTARVRQT